MLYGLYIQISVLCETLFNNIAFRITIVLYRNGVASNQNKLSPFKDKN